MSDKIIPVKVALRIRPLVSKERADGCTECLRSVKNEPQVILGKDKCFTYDYVFSQTTPQIEVFEQSVQPLLDALFKGYNATVLAYGQTGSGKTFTMGSGYQSLQSALSDSSNIQNQQININDLDEVGVIPRCLSELFRRIDDEQRQKGTRYTVKVSLIEIYNEEIKDLFAPKASALTAAVEPLNIREENNTIRVVNLSEIQVNNALSAIQLLEKGSAMRVVGGTAMNDQSSRSHAIFTISLEQIQTSTSYEDTPLPTSGGGSSSSSSMIKSKFHLVDLAGSERQSKTKAEGLRLKEGININLGLLALGNVISVLGEESNAVRHVPYRESKLTRLLQDSLGGNSHTVMIACVSPADSNMEETLNTLRYADRARKIKNKPVVNVDPQAAELVLLRQQVQQLKAQVYQLGGGGAGAIGNGETISTDLENLRDENERLKTENIKLINELKQLVKINRITYEKMTKVEAEKEELSNKVQEIKAMLKKAAKEQEAADLTTTLANTTTTGGGDVTMNITTGGLSRRSLLNDLESKIGEIEKIKENEQQASTDDDQDNGLSNDAANDEPAEKDYALRQAKMQVQLTEYDSELAKKESLFRKMMENQLSSSSSSSWLLGLASGSGGEVSSTSIDDLKSKIAALEKEKEELCDMLRSSDSASRKQAEQKRDRLKQLEADVLELRKKERELVKMIKLKEENEKHCEKLRCEIQNIKCERVKLLKQMRADTDSFRKYKQEKEKEVNHLKAMERKRMVEISKLQEGSHKQEAVLRRKNDEITRIQRQLRETLEKQKLVAEKRQQTFERKDSSTTADKLRQWITQELELSVNIAEARINLNKLIDERKESAAELTRLEEKLAATSESTATTGGESDMESGEMRHPAFKRKHAAADNGEDGTEDRAQLRARVDRLREDIECKSIQINDIQQMVLEGDQDEKSKHMFNNIHGLLEAKVLLKHLYNSGVQYLLDSKLKQVNFDNSSNSLNQELKDMKKRAETLEEELVQSKKNLSKEMNDLRQYYEQRILYELNTALNDSTCSADERFMLLKERIQALERKIDSKPGALNSTFAKPHTPTLPGSASARELGSEGSSSSFGSKDEFRRAQKLKKEHRKTRVIRLNPSEGSLLNITNHRLSEENETSHHQQLGEMSPYSQAMRALDLEGTPADDKVKDPDWANTPVGGIVAKKKRQTMTKRPTFRKTKSKSSIELPVIEANDENENV